MTDTETWGDMFDRAREYDVNREAIEQALERRLEGEDAGEAND